VNYPLVKDVATKEIIYLDSNDTLDSAIKLITEHGVRNIVVHDADIDEYAYIGVDEVVHAIATDLDTSSLIVNVGLHPLLCVPKDYNIFEASYFFIEDESLIGVINEDGTLFGVLSYIDILNATMNGKEDILSSPVR